MRFFLLSLLIVGWGASTLVSAPSIPSPSFSTNCDVVWDAPTNNWPATLWTYKVGPQNFSRDVISNLLAMTGLTESDKCRGFGDDSITDKLALRFKNSDGSKHLGIYPSFGFIEYKNSKAKAINQFQPVVNIPDPNAATQLGKVWLKKFGIESSDLAKKQGSDELDLHWEKETIDYNDAATKNAKTLTNMCGVFFLRQIDDIHFKGIGLNGGAEIAFGNNSNVTALQVCWRKLSRYQNRKCVSPQDLVLGIQNGSIRLPGKAMECGQINKIIITGATPLYDGNFGDERQEFVMPFITMQTHVIGSLKETNFAFETPILSPKK